MNSEIAYHKTQQPSTHELTRATHTTRATTNRSGVRDRDRRVLIILGNTINHNTSIDNRINSSISNMQLIVITIIVLMITIRNLQERHPRSRWLPGAAAHAAPAGQPRRGIA